MAELTYRKSLKPTDHGLFPEEQKMADKKGQYKIIRVFSRTDVKKRSSNRLTK